MLLSQLCWLKPQTINVVSRCAGRMLFAITVLVATSIGLGYQQLQLIRLRAQLLSLETEVVQPPPFGRDMSWADAWIRELWNSKHRLRPVMHPDQTWLHVDGSMSVPRGSMNDESMRLL